jgi:ferric iron reductase protein FhuF
MWAMVSDYVVEIAIGMLGSAATDESLAEIIGPLVRTEGSPMKARSWFGRVERERQTAYFCDRNGCCLTYKIPGTEKCRSCPLRPKAERIELMRDYLNSLP